MKIYDFRSATGIVLLSVCQKSYASESDISINLVSEDELDQMILEDAWTLYWQEQRPRFLRIKKQLKKISEADKLVLRDHLKEKMVTRDRKKSREQSCELLIQCSSTAAGGYVASLLPCSVF